MHVRCGKWHIAGAVHYARLVGHFIHSYLIPTNVLHLYDAMFATDNFIRSHPSQDRPANNEGDGVTTLMLAMEANWFLEQYWRYNFCCWGWCGLENTMLHRSFKELWLTKLYIQYKFMWSSYNSAATIKTLCRFCSFRSNNASEFLSTMHL